MSDLFDDDPRVSGGRSRSTSRRSRILLITLGILVLGFIGLSGFSALWTDRLWFKHVGYSGVFTTLIWTRIGLFFFFGVLMAVIVGVNIFLAYRFRPLLRPSSPEQAGLDRYRDAILPIRWWLLAGVSVLLGAFAGVSGAGQWRNFLLWRNGTSFGVDDAYFGRDAGFYIFTLPWLHYIVDFLMIALVVATLAAALVHYLFGGIRLQMKTDKLSPGAQIQLSVLLGVFVLVKGVDYWLDRYDLVTNGGGLLTGMTYTADKAILPAKEILTGIAFICAILFLLNIWRRTWLLPSVGVALLVLSGILLGLVWPAIVQNFQVKANQADLEEPYIANNIKATRDAYGITDVEETAYGRDAGEEAPSGEDLRAEAEQTGVRIADPSIIPENYEQEQQIRGYYSFPDVFDVDRYPVDGVDRDLVLAVRELNQDGLSESAKNWNNLHTVYTHGYGMVAAFGNQREADGTFPPANEKGPVGAEENLPPQGVLTDLAGEDGYRGQIYYGEQSPEYSIVGKRDEGANDIEVDIPTGGDEGERNSTYAGEGGVPVGGFFNKLLYAVKFSEPNIILSDRVHENSKILYNRDPSEMVKKVAPWLQVDGDVYPAMVDGRIQWIVDGYTTTDRYPSSDRQSLTTMLDDSLGETSQLQTLPTDEINYIRNSVKATVDAYDGTVTLYEWGEEGEVDPLLETWRKVFPGVVKDRSEIPDELLEHLRYPEDLFKVQRYQLASYHVTEASDFYQGNDRWEVPEDPNQTNKLQPPYRLSVLTPGGGDAPNFSLTSIYTPYNKPNLAAFVSVNADAASADYGEFEVLTARGSAQVDGPGQIAGKFANDPGVKGALRDVTLAGNTITYGNLLTLPVGEGLLYVQPIYVTRDTAGTGSGAVPELQQVAVAFDDRIGSGPTLDAAINDALSLDPDTDEPDEPDGDGNGDGDGGSQTTQDYIEDASAAYAAAQEALKDGDWAEYGRQMDLLQEALDALDQDVNGPTDEETPADN